MRQTVKKPKNRRKPPNGRHQAILDAALPVFAVKGFSKTTLSDITARSEVPEASIYEYFDNKEDILFRLAERFFRALTDNLQVHFLGVNGVRNRFQKFVWHHLYYFQEHLEFCRVFVLELLYNPRFRASDAYLPVEAYRRELRQILAEGVTNRIFGRYLDVALGEIMVFGSLNHMMLSKNVLDKPRSFILQAEGLCDLFFHAIDNDSYPLKETITGESGKRKQILAAALGEFTQNGFQQTSVSRIAKQAQVTEPTIYEHFKNKEELLYTIPKASMGQGSMVDSVDIDLRTMNTPVHRLRTLLVHQIRSVRDYPDYYYLLITELRGNLGFYNSEHYHSLREYSARLVTILSDGVKAGVFREDIQFELVRDLFFGLMDELTLTLHAKNALHHIVRSSEEIFDLIYTAIKVERQQRTDP